MNVLVTGAAGFIGSAVAKRLRDEGHKVVGIDDLSTGRLENVPAGITFVPGDLTLPQTLHDLKFTFEAVMHLAGQSSGELSFLDPINDLNRNTISTLNVIEFARSTEIQTIVHASSMSVYGDLEGPVPETSPRNPKSNYGVSKLASEEFLRLAAEEIRTISLRMFNVYGPGQDLANLRQGMVSIFLAMAIREKRITVRGALNRFRDFVYIDDVAEIWSSMLNLNPPSGIAVNIGSGTKTFVRELIDLIVDLNPGTEVVVDRPTPGDQIGIYADTRVLADFLFPFRFTPLEEGLLKFDAWAKQQFAP